jgi:hypothetical protein
LKEASRLINYRSSQASNRIGKRRLTTVNDRKRSLTIVNDCGTIAGDSIDSIDSTDRKIDRKIERKEEETTNLPSTTLPSALSLEEEMALEILYKRMVAEWKEIHGESATCPYPTFPEEKLSWKVLIGNHDHDLILKAFTLWAQEQYEQGNTERYPLGKFIRVADKYMQKIVPLKTATVVAQIEAEAKKVAMDEAKRLNDAIRAARKKEEEEESKDAGPEAYGL